MAFEGKTALVNLRVPPSLKAAAQKAAAEDRRSLTSLIEKLLVDYLRNNEYAMQGIPQGAAELPAQGRAHPARPHDTRGGQVPIGRAGGAVGRSSADRSYGRNY